MLFEFDELDFDCDKIHSGLIDMGEVVCFLCHKTLIDINKAQENKEICQECDSCSTLIEDDGLILCTECGYINDYIMVIDIALYDKCRIRKKSIYRSKYYIQKALNQFSKKHQIQVPVQIQLLICRVVDLIRSSEELMQGRKRIISFNYIIRRIFKRSGVPYNFILQPKCKITRRKYNTFWRTVMRSSVGDLIRRTV